jgi:hypothetical protein
MGIKHQLETLLVLLGINSGKIMQNKADKVRKLLTEGASRPKIVVAIMLRCRANHKKWVSAAIAQTARVLDISILHARALVSEYSGEKTAM